jgi:hypothetical protein
MPRGVVISGPGCELMEAHRHTHPKGYKPPGRSGQPELLPVVHGVCPTSDIEIGKGYIKQFESRWLPLDLESNGLGLNERPVSIRETVMSQQSVSPAARRSALDAQRRCVKSALTANGGLRGWRSRR